MAEVKTPREKKKPEVPSREPRSVGPDSGYVVVLQTKKLQEEKLGQRTYVIFVSERDTYLNGITLSDVAKPPGPQELQAYFSTPPLDLVKLQVGNVVGSLKALGNFKAEDTGFHLNLINYLLTLSPEEYKFLLTRKGPDRLAVVYDKRRVRNFLPFPNQQEAIPYLRSEVLRQLSQLSLASEKKDYLLKVYVSSLGIPLSYPDLVAFSPEETLNAALELKTPEERYSLFLKRFERSLEEKRKRLDASIIQKIAVREVEGSFLEHLSFHRTYDLNKSFEKLSKISGIFVERRTVDVYGARIVFYQSFLKTLQVVLQNLITTPKEEKEEESDVSSVESSPEPVRRRPAPKRAARPRTPPSPERKRPAPKRAVSRSETPTSPRRRSSSPERTPPASPKKPAPKRPGTKPGSPRRSEVSLREPEAPAARLISPKKPTRV